MVKLGTVTYFETITPDDESVPPRNPNRQPPNCQGLPLYIADCRFSANPVILFNYFVNIHAAGGSLF